MNCLDLADHFRTVGTWVDWQNTTDTFKAGNPSREVRTVAVAWKASGEALREAVSRGADLFVSHESICVRAINGSPEPEVNFALPSEGSKFDWLHETGLVVYRCHDVWDRFPGEGIRDSWQAGLEMDGEIIADEYPLYVTKIPQLRVRDFARHVLQKVRPLRQNGIMLSGNIDKEVSRIATGTGVTTDPVKMIELGADAGIMTDDYYLHVRIGAHACELDFPTIIVNHGVSEEWGVRNLVQYIGRVFPAVEVFHIPQYCAYTVLTDEGQPGDPTDAGKPRR